MLKLTVYLSDLTGSIKILWCCLIWYIYFVIIYFDPNLELWLRSLGIACLIGFVLNINAYHSLENLRKSANKWQIFRFFIIPFCVSSFPVLIKDKDFILFFSPSIKENLTALGLCALFLFLAWSSQFVKKPEACPEMK